MKKVLLLAALCCCVLVPTLSHAQVTTSTISGIVKQKSGEALIGATVKATHVPSGTEYITTSRTGGRYDIPNINPGGPYLIEVTYTGLEKFTREISSIGLGEVSSQDFSLGDQITELETVVVATTSRTKQGAKGGAEVNIGRDKMQSLPTVGRNVSDYLRYVPQAKVTGDGGIALAGQNNRYNSFYIDGAVNNDVFGLAASGTNGGQAGIAPISIDAIDQFQVVLSPYDASLGNFTGGGINATTRRGTNNIEGSIYYFFRNEDLSGKTPGVDKDAATKLSDFSNKTYGFRIGGPIVKNKLFFFLNGELQRDQRPQPFDPSTYNGDTKEAGLDALANYLRNTYNYDPGDFRDNAERVEADRIATRIDWKLNSNHNLTFSYRLNKALRYNTSRSSSSTINFYNNGYTFPSTTNSASAEWNGRFKGNANNKLLLTYTGVVDDRNPIGQAFPRVSITDGSGSIVFGTEEFSTGNKLKQTNFALFDVFKFYKGAHTFSIGTDDEISKSYNVFIRQNFGSYQFRDGVDAFLNGGTANVYNRSYSLLDPGKMGDESVNAAAQFTTLRASVFVNDEIKASSNLSLNLGVRLDYTNFLTTPREDKFFNDTAIGKISQYYDLRGARSGQISDPNPAFNFRAGFTYKIPEEGITVRGGLGTFTGRVPLVWPGGVYNNNGVSIAGINGSNVAFRSDPNDQYIASDFGATVPLPSGEINLISSDFKMNKVFRASLAVDKQFGQGWKLTVEGIYTKNINEIAYQSVNILPPTKTSVGPDVRNVYDLSGSFPAPIPMRANGSNPYTGVYLLYNNDGKKGRAYNISTSIDKAWNNGFALNANYTFGASRVLNEGTSSQNSSQWRYMETVNGRNYLPISTSDFDMGHRVNAYIAKKFTYGPNGLFGTTISLVYNGQSGSPISYAMLRGMVRDYDNNENNDLIYIPTESEIEQMVFLSNTTGGVTYTPAQQRELFNDFIESDKYLSKSRGMHSERNMGRLPFSNVIDLKLQQDFNIKIASRKYQVQLTYDVFNLTNMINRDWGRTWFASNDQLLVLNMTGFVSSSNLTPQYRYTPPSGGRFYNISDGVFNSSRWTSQLGIRINF